MSIAHTFFITHKTICTFTKYYILSLKVGDTNFASPKKCISIWLSKWYVITCLSYLVSVCRHTELLPVPSY